jgi:sodium/pantothenate symporter
VLLSSLTAYGVSASVCVAISLRSNERFDFDLLAERVTSFHQDEESAAKKRGRASSSGDRLAAARA